MAQGAITQTMAARPGDEEQSVVVIANRLAIHHTGGLSFRKVSSKDLLVMWQ